jgi:site-specific DNA recombinase
MNATPVAIDARGSADPPAAAQPIASQGAAWRERVAAAGFVVPEAMPLLDAGESGAPLMRPALERWREVRAAGAVDRLSGPSPERLARTDAAQVVRVDACRRAGGEGMFLPRAWGQSPADDRLLQGHGMLAEEERAQSIDRPRRGQRPAAPPGAVPGRCGAPDGSRSGAQEAGGGPAREESVPAAAPLVRQGLAGIGRARRTLGEVGRRLTQAGAQPRSGQTGWDRRAVWGRWKHPAETGTAACGTTRQAPRRPRRRAPRGRPVPPRRAVAPVAVPREAGLPMPVPARVAPEVCAAVQEP